jgi:hypothetical protein
MIENCFVIKNLKTDKFIGIDANSGGYPCDCEIYQCQRFTSVEKAESYMKYFKDKNWFICTLTINYSIS